MRTLQTMIQALLYPRSPQKGKLWSLGVVLLFCVVCFLLTTGSIPLPAFAAGNAQSQQKGHMRSLRHLDPPQPPVPTLVTCPSTDPAYATQCADNAAGQASAPWTPNNSNIQNPIAANSALLFFTDPAYTSSQPAVSQIWTIMLGIADCFIILVLMLNGVLVMLGSSVFRYSKAIEAIPRILLAIIVAQLSMAFITLTLGLNNALSKQLYESTQNAHLTSTFLVKEQFDVFLNSIADTTFSPTSHDYCSDSYCWIPLDGNGDYTDSQGKKQASGIYPQGLSYFQTTYAPDAEIISDDQPRSIQDCIDVSDPRADLPTELSTGGVMAIVDCTWPRFTITPNLNFTTLDIPTAMKSISGALDLMIDIMGLMLVAQVAIRIFFIDLYIVFAPMGIGCWALPADVGRGVTGMWFKGFISTVMVQFVQMTAIIVTQFVLGAIMDALTSSGQITNTVLPGSILDKLVNVAMLWFIFRIPSMFNTAPMRSMVEIGQTMSQTVSAFVGMQIAETQMTMAETFGGIEAVAGIGAMFIR